MLNDEKTYDNEVEEVVIEVGQTVIDIMSSEVHDRPTEEMIEDFTTDESGDPIIGVMKMWIGWFEMYVDMKTNDGLCLHSYDDVNDCDDCVRMIEVLTRMKK
jgi:hypothetical protein